MNPLKTFQAVQKAGLADVYNVLERNPHSESFIRPQLRKWQWEILAEALALDEDEPVSEPPAEIPTTPRQKIKKRRQRQRAAEPKVDHKPEPATEPIPEPRAEPTPTPKPVPEPEPTATFTAAEKLWLLAGAVSVVFHVLLLRAAAGG